MVCAARRSRDDEGWAKRVGTGLFYRLINRRARSQIPVDAGDFRLMDRRVVDALRALPERNRFMKGLYAWVGFRTEVLPYTPLPRHRRHEQLLAARPGRAGLHGHHRVHQRAAAGVERASAPSSR